MDDSAKLTVSIPKEYLPEIIIALRNQRAYHKSVIRREYDQTAIQKAEDKIAQLDAAIELLSW